MRIQNNVHNPNFNGFKNLIFEDFNSDIARITYLAAQLTDDKSEDLTALRDTLKNSAKEKHNLDRDVFALVSVAQPQLKVHTLFFNGEVLPTGKELKEIEKLIEVTNGCSEEKKMLNQDKKFAMKAYSLAASLTKRIATLSIADSDAGMAKVVEALFKDFQKIFVGNINSETLLQLGFFNKKEPQEIAILFNEYIKKTMKAYFK